MARYILKTTQEEAIYSTSDPSQFLENLTNTRIYKKLIKLLSKVDFSWANSNYFKIAIGLIVLAGLPIYSLYSTNLRYGLDEDVSKIIGSVPQNLSKKITYDGSKNAYVFNAAGMTQTTQTIGPDNVPLSLLQSKISGSKSNTSSLYSVVMPTDPKQGITYYDSNTGLSFQMVPDFTQLKAKKVDNHIVYPTDTGMQMVYTVKNNGLKEDIILNKYVSDSLAYRYSLKLPDTLEARMMNDGSGALGIYSADPALYNPANTTGPEADPAKIESARIHGQKTNLLFALPAPVIKSIKGTGNSKASFGLSQDGLTLTISADGLKGLNYPVSIDPTVVITSTSDFNLGNNEDNNISYPGNQINRGSLTGGSISGGWTATTVLPTANRDTSSAAYNGYAYEVGGYSGAGFVNTVLYAPIVSDGTIGAWTSTTVLPSSIAKGQTVAYNGYLYYVGGFNGSAAVSTVYYAQINLNGSVGTWSTTTALSVATEYGGAVAYNGYLYSLGGDNGASTSAVYYAPINANGTIGSWTPTTALSVATNMATSVVYNGYLYEIGGNASGATANVYYAPIKTDGSIGSWASTTALPVATYVATSVVYNGYVYEIGGFNGSSYFTTVYYAPINANGTIGTWTASVSITTATDVASSIAYNGYIYEIGGWNGTTTFTTVNFAKIDPAGMTSAYSTTTVLSAATQNAATVAYNNYIYEIGGNTGSVTANVYFATINSSGTLGSWTADRALPVAIQNASATVYNGYLYVVGGYNGSAAVNTVYYALIGSNGTLGVWSSGTVLTNATQNGTATAYNGYLYFMGGNTGSNTNAVYYTPINSSNGSIGTWSTGTVLLAATQKATSVAYNGYLYEIGGNTGSTTTAVSYTPINTSNGSLGSWSTATVLPTGIQNAISVVYNGYLYEIGGNDGTSNLTSVYYAPIGTSGSLGSWATNTVLTTATAQASGAVYNGYIYLLGGVNPSVATTVSYARINNGGPGTAGTWSTTQVLNSVRYDAASVIYNGYVYEIAGNNGSGTAQNLVEYSALGASGTLGTWQTANALPIALSGATAVSYNGNLYIIGGYVSGAPVNTVYYAAINSNGSLGTWSTTTSITTATYQATSVAYNGYMYEIGGNNGSLTAVVQYAPIYSNGTLGAWSSLNSLPSAVGQASSVVYNGYLYEIGGSTGSATNAVNYAVINGDGTLGSWVATYSLPVATYNSKAVAYNGYLYEIGGNTGSVTANVYLASFNANGTIGNWTQTTALGTALERSTAVVYNGYLYNLGGNNSGGTTVTTTYYSPISSMPRIAHYSNIFNFGSLITPSSITYTGNLPNAYGLSPIQYKTAGTNAIFGSINYSNALGSTAAACDAAGSSQYIQMIMTLDDSNSAAFPDVNDPSFANAQDFTVSYTTLYSTPNLRLRGGKFFTASTLGSLDTCNFNRTVPASVTGLATTGAAPSVTVSWNAATSTSLAPVLNIDVYQNNSLITTLAASATSYAFTGLTSGAGNQYVFKVVPKNSAGNASASAIGAYLYTAAGGPVYTCQSGGSYIGGGTAAGSCGTYYTYTCNSGGSYVGGGTAAGSCGTYYTYSCNSGGSYVGGGTAAGSCGTYVSGYTCGGGGSYIGGGTAAGSCGTYISGYTCNGSGSYIGGGTAAGSCGTYAATANTTYTCAAGESVGGATNCYRNSANGGADCSSYANFAYYDGTCRYTSTGSTTTYTCPSGGTNTGNSSTCTYPAATAVVSNYPAATQNGPFNYPAATQTGPFNYAAATQTGTSYSCNLGGTIFNTSECNRT